MNVHPSTRPIHIDDEGAVMAPLVFSNSSGGSSRSSPTMILNRKSSDDSREQYNYFSRSKGVSFHVDDNDDRDDGGDGGDGGGNDDGIIHHCNNNKTNNLMVNNHHTIPPTSSPTSTRGRHNNNNNADDNEGSPVFNPFQIHSRPEQQQIQHHHHHHHHHLHATATTSTLSSPKSPKKLLVPSSGYGKFGPIQYRASLPSMLFKKWQDGYWLHVYPATIVVFDSLEDMKQWKEMDEHEHESDRESMSISNEGPLEGANKYKDKDSKKFKNTNSKMRKEMNNLVKVSINFDTTGDLRKKIRKLEQKNKKLLGGGQGQGHGHHGSASMNAGSGSRPRKQKVSDCNHTLPVNYVMERVRSKYYRKDDPLMHTFKISYLGLAGRNVSAAFGSSIPQEVKRLRAVIRDVLHLTKKASKKRNKQGGAFGETASTMFKVPNSSKSEITALSNTVYGHNTMTNQATKQFNYRLQK